MKKERNNNENVSFADLDISPKILKAIEDIGFETPTEIQSKAIPLIKKGIDVIGRSQTGTGKTVAFAVPALEMIKTDEEKSTVQAIIMLPTRELALQCGEEIRKLSKYKNGIRPVEVYGGAAMDRQITQLKRANIVVGTPGRIMDHLRRRTLKLNHVKIAILDEADEMLSMGFKEDMETILRETPESRQTVLFSATMPQSIMEITKEFQHSPKIIEINNKQVTLDNIKQSFVDVPMGRKMDALKLLLYYYEPKLSIVFCNTKKMAEELSEELIKSGFNADALHGDLKQSQRNTVMDKFRCGSTSILVATDVAARGIDVNNVEYVFNYDIPQHTEYYVHRIGRTGRIGKEGNSVTICSGMRQVLTLKNIIHETKSSVKQIDVPTADDIKRRINEKNIRTVIDTIDEKTADIYSEMINSLLAKGNSLFDIAAAALQLSFEQKEVKIKDIKSERKQTGKYANSDFSKIVLNIGRASHVAPNHIVASITERSILHGSDIGKIEIYDNSSIVSIPSTAVHEVLEQLYGAKVCGKPIRATLYEEDTNSSYKRNSKNKIDKHIGNRSKKCKNTKDSQRKSNAHVSSVNFSSKRGMKRHK